MTEHYVITNWGPMKAVHKKRYGNLGSDVSSLTKDAPADMDTFLEVANKYSELKERLDNLDPTSSSNLIEKVSTLPTATKDTMKSIYLTNDGFYVTINSGTDSAPNYVWQNVAPADEFATLDDIDALWSDSEEVEWEETQQEIDLTLGEYDSDNHIITWTTDDLIVQQITGQGVTQVGNYLKPIRFYDSNILTFHIGDDDTYISEILLIKATKDGGGTIKPGVKLGNISGKSAVVSSLSLTATKNGEGWVVTADEELKTDSVCLQYDGQVIDEVDLYAVGQLLINRILVTLKKLV